MLSAVTADLQHGKGQPPAQPGTVGVARQPPARLGLTTGAGPMLPHHAGDGDGAVCSAAHPAEVV